MDYDYTDPELPKRLLAGAEDLLEEYMSDCPAPEAIEQRKAEAYKAADRQSKIVQAMEAERNKLKDSVDDVLKSTDALMRCRGDAERLKEEIRKLEQQKFDRVVSVTMAMDCEGSLDRFRAMSQGHKSALFNAEKAAVEERLNAQVARAQESINAQGKEIEAYKGEVAKLSKSLSDKRDELAVKENELDGERRMREEDAEGIKNLKDSLAVANEGRRKAEEDHRLMLTEYREAAELTKSREAALKGSLGEAKDSTSKAVAELEKERRKTADLQGQFERQLNLVSAVERTLEVRGRELLDLEIVLGEGLAEIRRLDVELDKESCRVQELRAEDLRSRDVMTGLRARLVEEEQKVSSALALANAESNAHVRQVQGLEDKAKETARQLAEEKEKVSGLAKDLRDSKASSQVVEAGLQGKIKGLEDKLRESAGEVRSHQKHIEEGKAQIRKIEEELAIERKKVGAKVKELKENTDKVEDLHARLAGVTEDLSAAKLEAETFGRKLEKMADVEYKLRIVEANLLTTEVKLRAAEADFQASQTSLRVAEQSLRDKETGELGMARFFMAQSCLGQDAQTWLPFVRALSVAEFVAASQQVGEDRAWTVVRPWGLGGNPAAAPPPADLTGLLVRLYGRLRGEVWDDETLDVVCLLTTEMERAGEAPVSLVAKVVESALEPTVAAEHASLATFGLWQLVCLVRRRWPEAVAEEISQLEEALEGQVMRVIPLRVIRDLLGHDCGRQLKALVRQRQDPGPGQQVPGESDPASVLASLPVQYCPEQDVGLLSLPRSERNVWALGLGSNTIRLIRNTQLYLPKRSSWVLRAAEGDVQGEIRIPSDTFRDLDWVADYIGRD